MLEWFLFGLFGTFISHVVVPHVSVSLFLLSCAAYVIPASSPFHFLSQHFFLFEPIGQILLNLQKRTNTKQNSCEERCCRKRRIKRIRSFISLSTLLSHFITTLYMCTSYIPIFRHVLENVKV